MKPLDIVIFGGAGDLSLRKLLPALYYATRDGQVPKGSRILCVSRTKYEHEVFLDMVKSKLQVFLTGVFDEKVWKQFKQHLLYKDIDLGDTASWQKLVDFLGLPEDRTADFDREIVYYLSVPPALFQPVCEQLKAQALNPAYSRLVVEKPLGESLESAKSLNKVLSSTFPETQIYRIDHYLGKEAVQNLFALRFSNRLIEAAWNRDHIQSVEITVAETVGLEGRAEYLDRTGVLRDMVQSHLLQLVCCIAMDTPLSIDPDDIRDEKVRVLKALEPITAENVAEHVVRGQYGVGELDGEKIPSYLSEVMKSGKELDGTGETYVALKLKINTDRWQDVPFYVRTGKRLPSRYAQVIVRFKPVLRNLFETEQHNTLVIEVQPNLGITLNMFMKQVMSDGAGLISHRQEMDLGESLPEDIKADSAGEYRFPSAYEKLLIDVIKGNQTYFVRDDEIFAAWKWIDGVRAAWAEAELPMQNYSAGGKGPSAADALLEHPSHAWSDVKGAV
ncbi:MAG: glucose-6-phosphate dehydrogenase [Kordiimonadaceae bacterium]|nr:glucose-6-phosphate dehydrogenase [Kordiimonadaceae bacterium]